MPTVDELVAQINKEYEKNKEPDKNALISEIMNIFSQLKTNGREFYYIKRENIDIHPEIQCLHIKIEPEYETELVIDYDKEGGYKGIDIQFMSHEALVATKQKLVGILQHIIDYLKYEQVCEIKDIKQKLTELIKLAGIKSIRTEVGGSIMHIFSDLELVDPNHRLWSTYEGLMSELVNMGNQWLNQNKDKTSEDVQKEIDERKAKRWAEMDKIFRENEGKDEKEIYKKNQGEKTS